MLKIFKFIMIWIWVRAVFWPAMARPAVRPVFPELDNFDPAFFGSAQVGPVCP